MPRRVSLPAADDLFRPGPGGTGPQAQKAARAVASVPDPEPVVEAGAVAVEEQAAAGRKPSGRVRHDEKMTVYVTSDELLDLEHARLSLRRHQGLAVDRGRLVREAIALALADLEERGEDSDLVQRLRGA
ncbi:hypothetical protein ASG49_08065 [Marmoricola sp. Leaf446]|uniref:hypothetical protein n=1 Tax=Marmoricola sp. Leaf446 TaxID=1736379 RepID=UPI0006F274AC|nr:hypothetical protein [Marmoricola sp. Leaf446]KQT94762.1 hypothetical protein ASG49_08065 [Marmoricola sp. Leaf446]